MIIEALKLIDWNQTRYFFKIFKVEYTFLHIFRQVFGVIMDYYAYIPTY